MSPLFKLDAEEEEQSLKGLPYVVDWFERAQEAVSDEHEKSYNIDQRKLSAIYQFVQSMPLQFVPTMWDIRTYLIQKE